MSTSTPTIAEFLETVRKSGLVEPARLEEATAAWPDHAAPLPEELVQSLIDAEVLTKWQADRLRKGSHNFMLGKYRLLRLIGAGGMSSVYLAEHTALQSKVAIKVLPRARVNEGSYLARFEREAQASARLSHPNIVRAFDLDTAGSIHFIAMEYVDGIDLHAKVKQDGPLPLRQAVDYVRQAALGLQYAHEEGLIHRDIKPANLILDSRGTVKILDLGLAFAKGEDDDSLTQANEEKVLGTADYLSPEQAKDSHKADARSDIYALGCTLYYLLTGRPPFAKGTLAERIQAHLRTPPPNLLEERPDVPPALVDLYFRMMEKHPEARPQTAGEVATALTAWLAAAEKAAPAARPEPPRRAPPRRSPAPGSGAAAGTPGSRGPGGSGIGAPLRPPAAPSSRSPSGPGGLPFPQSGRKGSGISPRGPGSGIRLDTGAAPATGRPATGPSAQPARPQLGQFLGIPLGAWIAVAAGLLLAAYLGWQVIFTSKKKPKKSDAKNEPPAATAPDSEEGADNSEEPTADALEEGDPEDAPGKPQEKGKEKERGKKTGKKDEASKPPPPPPEDELTRALRKALEESNAKPEAVPEADAKAEAKPDAEPDTNAEAKPEPEK